MATPQLNLPAGLVGTAELIVGDQHTAPRIGSGRIRVLATPVMINLIEAAALAAIEQSLPEHHQSLGTHLDVTHVAATPVGMRVRATAEVVRVEGRTVHFRVRADDERELIGEGTHERVVVNVERFDQRGQAKIKKEWSLTPLFFQQLERLVEDRVAGTAAGGGGIDLDGGTQRLA